MSAGSDAEGPYVDEETVKGYQRVVMCEAVRDEVDANLGEGRDVCRCLLADIIADRLLPTPWLNQV